MHDVASDKITWFAHHTKRGYGANWVGISRHSYNIVEITQLNPSILI